MAREMWVIQPSGGGIPRVTVSDDASTREEQPMIDERDADTIIIGNGSKEFRSLEPQLKPGQVVIDLVRAFGPRRSDGKSYEGICW